MPDTGGGIGINISLGGLLRGIGDAISGRGTNTATGQGAPLGDPNYSGPPVRLRPTRPYTSSPPSSPPPSTTNEPQPIDYATYPAGSPYAPAPGPSARGGKRKKKKKKDWLDRWYESMDPITRSYVEPAIEGVIIARTYDAGNVGGMSAGGRRPRSSSGARMPTKQTPFNFTAPRNVKQAGFLDTSGLFTGASRKIVVPNKLTEYGPSAQPRRVAIGKIVSMDEVNLPGALDEVQVTAQKVGRAATPNMTTPGTAPETRTQDYVNAAAIDRAVARGLATAYPFDSGPRPTAAAQRVAGKSGTVTRPASGTTKTGTGAKVARALIGKIVLPVDSLLADLLRQPGRRSAGIGTIRLAPGAATSVTQPPAQPARSNPFGLSGFPGFAGIRTTTATDTCECDKPKKRKPRAPRSECWKGSYIETARGLKKTRREQVPC